MKERPILFNGEMVRAILSGRKTQTRRVMKPQPEYDMEYSCWQWPSTKCETMIDLSMARTCAPLGRTGDRLWVRECWGLWDTEPKDGPDCARVLYRATDADRRELRYQKWRPSIHMPRWASRLDLEITGTRAERVQDASRLDLAAEGWDSCGYQQAMVAARLEDSIDDGAIEWFADLWDSVSPPGHSWDANPWVWVYEFRMVRP